MLIENTEIRVYKKYPNPKTIDPNTPHADILKTLHQNPAMIHYKYKELEWWSEFDEYDNEIHFRCNNGFEYYKSYKFDETKNRFVLDSYDVVSQPYRK